LMSAQDYTVAVYLASIYMYKTSRHVTLARLKRLDARTTLGYPMFLFIYLFYFLFF
jgi:hypothetical protein